MQFELKLPKLLHFGQIQIFKEEHVFKINFPMLTGTEKDKIESVLPVGWMIEATNSRPDRFWLVKTDDGSTHGSIQKLPGEIIISADENIQEGKEFWQQFSLKYPNLNPFTLKFGVLYLPGDKGKLWELDQLPKDRLEEVSFERYCNVNNAFQVSFMLGNWHPREEIILSTCKRINRNGTLGKDEGNRMFLLGSLENENTM